MFLSASYSQEYTNAVLQYFHAHFSVDTVEQVPCSSRHPYLERADHCTNLSLSPPLPLRRSRSANGSRVALLALMPDAEHLDEIGDAMAQRPDRDEDEQGG